MPPRKYHQVDEGTYVPFAQPDQLLPAVHRPIWTMDNQERLDSLRYFGRIHHRTTAGHKDPMSVLQLIDILQRWNPDFYVRAKYAARGLNERSDQFYYEAVTVGKMLAELADIAADEWEHRPELTPIKEIMDYKGAAFLLLNEITTYKWFWQIRQGLITKSQEIMERETRGTAVRRFESAYEGIDVSAVV